MVASSVRRLVYSDSRLGHADVLSISREVRGRAVGMVVVLDLRRTRETTTAALAALILLRRWQIHTGGDLLLMGLSGKAQYLYEILRLAKILPRRPCVHERRAEQLRRNHVKLIPGDEFDTPSRIAG